jgi:hypothetical protein
LRSMARLMSTTGAGPLEIVETGDQQRLESRVE